MILDRLENKNYYININNKFEKAFEFLTNNNLEKLADGRYEIDLDNIYALVQSYTTKANNETKWETHRKYIDIQYIVKGEECIGWIPVDQLNVSEQYSDEKDIAFYYEVPKWSELGMKLGYFGIFFPEDGHKPCCISNMPMDIKKVVVKIKL